MRPLDTPVRLRQITAEEGSLFAPPGQPEANDQIGWHRALDEPLRIKRMPTAAQLGYTFVAAAPGSGTAYNWFQALDELSASSARRRSTGLTFVAPAPGANTALNWWQQLDEPLRIKRTPRTELGYGNFTPAAGETVTIDKWWRELDRPVLRRRITAEEGSVFASPPRAEANDQIAWHRQLDWHHGAKLSSRALTGGAAVSRRPTIRSLA